MLRKIINWLTFRDYEIAKAEATRNAIHPTYMDEAALQHLSREGDKAMRRLRARLPKDLGR